MASMVKDVKDHKQFVWIGPLEFVSNLCNATSYHFSLPCLLQFQTSKYLLKYLNLVCLLLQLHPAKGQKGLKLINFPRESLTESLTSPLRASGGL